MHRIAVSMLCAAVSAAAAQGIYSPSVVHGTSGRPAATRPAAPLQPAAPVPGVASITPSVVLGWGGLPPSTGAPLPGYPVQVVPVPVPVPVYPSPYGPAYPLTGYPPMAPPGMLHPWSSP